jgi:hydroxymethylbilane synthase
MSARIRLGTRGSPLALWQANWVKSELERHWPDISVTLVEIKTSGDKILGVPLAEVGGKGLFTRELDEALLNGSIDAAVHSMKDIPFQMPGGIVFAAIPEREDPRDAFVSLGRHLDDLPPASKIGTSSLRREVQLRHRFPSIRISMLRGNVDTRLRKLADGEFDGIVLAVAGLRRLGRQSAITQVLDEGFMLPAVGQGALGIVCRGDDADALGLLQVLDHQETRLAVTAERGLLAVLEGSCKVPIAGKARVEGDRIILAGLVANLSGTVVLREEISGSIENPRQVGLALGQELIRRGADRILAEISQHGTSR